MVVGPGMRLRLLIVKLDIRLNIGVLFATNEVLCKCWETEARASNSDQIQKASRWELLWITDYWLNISPQFCHFFPPRLEPYHWCLAHDSIWLLTVAHYLDPWKPSFPYHVEYPGANCLNFGSKMDYCVPLNMNYLCAPSGAH